MKISFIYWNSGHQSFGNVPDCFPLEAGAVRIKPWRTIKPKIEPPENDGQDHGNPPESV